MRPDQLHPVERLLEVVEGFRAHREFRRQELSEVTSSHTDGLPALSPFRVAQSLINLRGISIYIVILVATRIHAYGQQDHKVYIDTG